jgi:haloalkane dehalogenase
MPSVDVLDSHITYTEAGCGAGPVVVFLHGNPTSSYLWREVIPHLAGQARCLAPDLIGMGASGKPDIGYTFADQARYLDAWFDALLLDEVILVGHDWGGALAFDWAARHPVKARGAVFMESIIRPLRWNEFPAPARARYQALRSPGVGEKLALEENAILESMNTLTPLSETDLAAYRRPYPTRESRRPLLAWTRAIPIDGEPADVAHRLKAYGDWLAGSADVPKLLLTFEGGQLVGPEMVAWCIEHIAHLGIANCGKAGHQAPEDQPHAIGMAISGWLEAESRPGPPPTGAGAGNRGGAGATSWARCGRT